MTYNVKKKKNYILDCHLLMTVFKQTIGGREVYDLPQHLQHIDKQNKTKVSESKLKETILS